LTFFLADFLADGLADPWADPVAGDALLAPTFFPPFPPFLEMVFLMFLEPAAAFLGALLVVCLAATLAIKKVRDHVKSSKNSLSTLTIIFELQEPIVQEDLR
jgi:hypothetical protein